MFDADRPTVPPTRLKTLQLIVAAMALGAFVFLAIVLLVPAQKAAASTDLGEKQPIITYVAIAYGLLAFPVGPLLSTFVANAGRRRLTAIEPQPDQPARKKAAVNPPDSGQVLDELTRAFSAKTLIAAAIYEGAALLLCIAYLLDHLNHSAILAAALSVGILLHLPTRDRAQQWMDQQLQLIEQDREMLPTPPAG